jgi:hypothetical protein
MDELYFCPRCFATDEDGSWSHTTGDGLCSNCGATGPAVQLPRWAVASIREQASWIGKRYYPHQEDHERDVERRALLARVTEFPGRTVEAAVAPGTWCVSQQLVTARTQTVLVTAESPAAALEAARYLLTYVPH